MIWRSIFCALVLTACASTPPAPDKPAAAAPGLSDEERNALATEMGRESQEGAFKYELQTFVHSAICSEDRRGLTGDAYIAIRDGKVVDVGFFDGSPDSKVDLMPKLGGKDAPPVPAKWQKLFADGKPVYFSFAC